MWNLFPNVLKHLVSNIIYHSETVIFWKEQMEIRNRNRIVAAATLVSLILIGISIGVWSLRGEESKIALYNSNCLINNQTKLFWFNSCAYIWPISNKNQAWLYHMPPWNSRSWWLYRKIESSSTISKRKYWVNNSVFLGTNHILCPILGGQA